MQRFGFGVWSNAAIFAAVVALAWPAVAGARGHSGGGSSHSSGHHSSGGSVSVRSYTRKDGTFVHAHTRSAPDGNFSNNWSTRGNFNPYTGKAGTRTSPYAGSSFVRTTARTTYRTTARTGYQLGALGAAPIAEAEDESEDTPLADETISSPAMVTPAPPPVPKPDLPTRYIAHFVSGKQHPVNNFVEDNGSWLLYGVTGGYIRYPTSLVSYFEPTPEAIGVFRKWADSAGSHHATAKFIRIDGQDVILAKSDRNTVHVPLEKLSETDRDLAQRLQELTVSQTPSGAQ